MLGTKARDIPSSSNSAALDPQSQAADGDYRSSTPRSELNNPMADPSILIASTSKESNAPVDKGKRLSAAGASASLLKRADPKDLPSYPSRGYQSLEASAGKAALLAHSQSKSPEIWKPDPLPAAGAAASLAHNMKSPEPWNPGPLPTAAAAAMLAGDSHKSPNIQEPKSSKSAFRPASHVKDKKSVDSTRRLPTPSTSNALTAAGLANQNSSAASSKPKSAPPITPAYDINKLNAMASQNAQTRLANANPPPSQSQADKNMSDILRAASISMSKGAKKSAPPRSSTANMPPGSYYSHIPTSTPNVIAETSSSKLNRKSSLAAASIAVGSESNQSNQASKSTFERQTRHYPHLEEAARKAASERLARLQAEHDKARQESGLAPNWQTQGARSATMSSAKSSKAFPTTVRKEANATDYARSLKIKAETAKLGKQIEAVDKDRQARDYLALLSVAEKNVKSRMQDLETKVAEDQGRVPKHLQEEWDAKAKILSEEYERKRNAEKESKKGKINMGGGLWYDQEDLERIAKGNVQPILDEINVKAEKERARLEALRLEKEERERERKVQMEREADTKAEVKKAKATEKAAAKVRRDNEKAEERQRKFDLKESQRQEKERIRSEKQPQKIAPDGQAEGHHDEDMEELEPRPMSQAGYDRVDRERELHEERKREKGWFGSIQKRLVRKEKGKDDQNKGMKDKISDPIPYIPEDPQEDGRLGEDDDEVDDLSSLSSHSHKRSSLRNVALAGTVSPISDGDDEGGVQEQMKRHGRYIPSDSDSSTSSDDLYTTRTYNPLTSATYNPGGTEDMPAFIPDTGSDEDEGKAARGLSPRGLKSGDHKSTDGEQGEEQHIESVKKQYTFGDLLKNPFQGFGKESIKKEEEKEKEVQREQDETLAAVVAEKTDNSPITLPLSPPRASAKKDDADDEDFQEARDSFDESGNGVTSNAGEGVRKIREGEQTLRASKFNEDL